MSSETRIEVANASFAIDRLAQDCGPLQYLREFTQNGIEAIGRDGGLVAWVEDGWSTAAQECAGRKLGVYDTGTGMSAEELQGLIGQLFSSGRRQALDGNFGVGAKISSLPSNPLGVVYTTLKDNVTVQLHLYRNSAGDWCLKSDDTGNSVWAADGQLPPAVLKAGHGTMVTFLGTTPEEDTVRRPDHVEHAETAWIIKWLNSRYFTFPYGIQVKGDRFEGVNRHSLTVSGQRDALTSAAQSKGSFALPEGIGAAHWWIIDETKAKANGSYASLHGHVGVLHHNELYEVTRIGPASYAHLRACGVTFGGKSVVIYFELSDQLARAVVPDTARTRLIYKHQEFPLGDFEEAFAKSLPKEILAHVEKSAPTADDEVAAGEARKQLESVLKRLGFERYRLSGKGDMVADDEDRLPGAYPADLGGAIGSGSGDTGGEGGADGGGYRRGGDQATAVAVAGLELPKIRWVSTADNSRADDEMIDRAAQYVPRGNLILVNADFRGFVSLEAYWRKQLEGVIGADETVRTALRTEVDLALIEAVTSILYFKRDKGTWKTSDRDTALSAEALTAVAMQRFRYDQAIMRATRRLKKAVYESR